MFWALLGVEIGATYTVTRRTEPRIAEQVWAALGDARTVLNVGAGTGSYEPLQPDGTARAPPAPRRPTTPHNPGGGGGPRPPGPCRSRTTPSTGRWRSPRCTTGRTRSPACGRCVAW